MNAKAILNLIPTLQSTALLGENINIPKRDGSGKGIRTNRGRSGCKETNLIGQGIKNIIGITLIKEQANLIGSLK